jgi:hypothetical protein
MSLETTTTTTTILGIGAELWSRKRCSGSISLFEACHETAHLGDGGSLAGVRRWSQGLNALRRSTKRGCRFLHDMVLVRLLVRSRTMFIPRTAMNGAHQEDIRMCKGKISVVASSGGWESRGSRHTMKKVAGEAEFCRQHRSFFLHRNLFSFLHKAPSSSSAQSKLPVQSLLRLRFFCTLSLQGLCLFYLVALLYSRSPSTPIPVHYALFLTETNGRDQW